MDVQNNIIVERVQAKSMLKLLKQEGLPSQLYTLGSYVVS